jgi:hypothetical protein
MQPGSLNLVFGFACDALPRSVAHVIARRITTTNPAPEFACETEEQRSIREASLEEGRK